MMNINFKSKKSKFIIAGVIILGIIGYLTYAGIRDTKLYYLTPNEIVNMGNSAYGERLRLGGIVMDGSIEYDAQTMILKFDVTDGTTSLPVVYKGVLPDTFKNGVEVVVEGTYASNGVFKAVTLLTKCPSKYEPKS